MRKQAILYKDEARQKLIAGAEKLSHAVISTLGPRSKNVAIAKEPVPIIVHDGVTVARGINLKDKFEDIGAQLIKEASAKTNDIAGDGTTTATLIAYTLIKSGMKAIRENISDGVFSETVNAMELREGLLHYADEICDHLDTLSEEISSYEKTKQIASISAQNKKIGESVAKALKIVGKDGVVMVEEGSSFIDEIDVQEGMELDNGFLSPYFITDPSQMLCEYEDGYILITDHIISEPSQIVKIINLARKDNNKPLLIIAGDIVGSALHTMVLSKLKAQYNLVGIVAPEFGERRREVLEDIAILTGGEVISYELNRTLEDVYIKDLGRFDKLRVDFRKTIITPHNPDKDEVEKRLNSIREIVKREQNTFIKKKHRERLARLSMKVALIKVGGGSESEMRERKERFIDAVHATKAGLAEGIVCGGGVALLQVITMLKGKHKGLDLILEALQSPYKTILENAGIDFVELTDSEVKKGIGVDVLTKEKVDMKKSGIIDPVKVTKLAIRHGISVASMILTTDTLIADEEDNEKDNV
jgi:chaperonin GroEL